MKSKLFSFIPLIIVLGLSLITIVPLFHSGFYPVHDNVQVQRVYELYKALKDGMAPVRWVQDLGYGYGYPLFNFYGPLAYYIGAFFVFLFSNSLLGTKIMIGIAMVGSGVTMYALASSLWGKWGGLAASILYLFAPYHAVDMYVRGDIGELWAYVFFPLVFWGFYKLFLAIHSLPQAPNKILIVQFSIVKWAIVGAIGFAGIILSHNLSAFMITPFLLTTCVALLLSSRYKLQTAFYLLLTVLFGLFLSTFYWLPVFTEMQYTNVLSQVGGTADFHDHFVCLEQLWQSPWGFGGSVPGCIDGFSFMIGKVHILLSVLAVMLLPFVIKQKKLFVATLLCIAGLLVSVFFMLSISTVIWNVIHQMAFLQYPWRYLLLASLFSSLLGGMVVSFAFSRQKILGVGLCLVVVMSGLFLYGKYFKPQLYIPVNTDSLTAIRFLEWTTSKISDEYMPKRFTKPKRPEELPHSFIVPSRDHMVQKEMLKTQEKNDVLTVSVPHYVFVNQAYFPGWKAFDNGRAIQIQRAPQGMKVYLSSGMHKLTFVYRGTFVENLSNAISLTSVIILILAIIWEISKIYDRKST